jgi:NADPH:quinone reductase-like Zn-dependent oxidoreductase
MHPLPITLPHILGAEIAGTVVEASDKEMATWVGRRVSVAPFTVCGHCEFCVAGREEVCLSGGIMGRERHGGYAEFVSVPATNLIELPDGVAIETASALTLSALTAWHMLVTCAALQPGETVLVVSAGSGVGSSAVQIAKLCGARVLATCGRPEQVAGLQALGVEAVYDYRSVDVLGAVRQQTQGRGVDVVFEHVGADTWETSVSCLARNGRLVTCCATSGSLGKVDIRQLYVRQLKLIGAFGGRRTELRRVLSLAAAGKLQPVIDQNYSFADAAVAHQRLEDRQQFGKLLLRPD